MSATQSTIFISVAAFCDPLLLHTVEDGVRKAAQPEALVWAVVDQHPQDRGAALRAVTGRSSLRYLQLHPVQSRGVCWARSVVGSLYAGEDYFLQIDSHMLFEPGWDTELIAQLRALRLRSARPIVSIYPYGFDFHHGAPVVTDKFDPAAALVFKVDAAAPMTSEQVTLTFKAVPVSATEAVEGFHVAGGFLFAPGEFAQQLPYDPRLYFHGEEQSLALRAYTHGWDVFHPIRIPLYHHYKPAGQSHDTQHWQPQWESRRDFRFQDLTRAAHERLLDLVDQRRELGIYGLGQVRTLQSFATASGIDYAHRQLLPPMGPVSAGGAEEEDVIQVVELNPHHPRPFVFTDYARSLVEVLRVQGIRARHVVNALPYQGRLLMLGWTPQWLVANRQHVHPGRAILFNAEPLGSDSPVATEDYLQAMRGWVVADIHDSNVRFLKERLGDAVRAVELPVVPHTTAGLRVPDLPVDAVDVVFVGSRSERRRRLLDALTAQGLKLRVVEGAYGLELMPWLQKARLLVHIHHDESRLFPVLRMLRPAMMGLPVVCESSVFSSRNDWSTSGIHFCDAQQIATACQTLLADPQRLRAMGRACRHHARSVDIASAWQELSALLQG